MENNVTKLLGIRYPIVQGAMQWLSVPELAAAVSNAGGLGIITAATCPDKESLKAEIRRMKSMTDKPFAVNISLLPKPSPTEKTPEQMEAVLEEGVAIVETSGRNPDAYVERLKKAGVTVMHKVPSVRYALKAQQIGVDLVTIVGFECGGHPGMKDTSTMIQMRRASEKLSIPFLAGGGVADANGLAAAFALGAQGVVVGTRFIASTECQIHPNFKKWVLESSEEDTMLVQRSVGSTTRARRNAAAERVLELEGQGASLADLMPIISGQITRRCYAEGETEGCVFPLGQSAGLVHEIKPVQEIIEELFTGARAVAEDLQRLFGQQTASAGL